MSDSCECGKNNAVKWKCAGCGEVYCKDCIVTLKAVPNQSWAPQPIKVAFPDYQCSCGRRITGSQKLAN